MEISGTLVLYFIKLFMCVRLLSVLNQIYTQCVCAIAADRTLHTLMCVFVGLITVCNRNDFLALARNLDKMFLFSFPSIFILFYFLNICLTVNLYSHWLIYICLCFYKQWTVQKKVPWDQCLCLAESFGAGAGKNLRKRTILTKNNNNKTERERD